MYEIVRLKFLNVPKICANIVLPSGHNDLLLLIKNRCLTDLRVKKPCKKRGKDFKRRRTQGSQGQWTRILKGF